MSVVKNDECLICKSKKIKTYPAQFADFIADRVFDKNNQEFDFIHCQDCGFAFYNYRFEPNEIEKLYHNYRDDEYQKQRQKYESWYSSDINNLIGKNNKEIKSRCNHFTKMIFEYISDKNLQELKILDFGGDKGQFIPQIFKQSEKYVYDISGQDVLDDIIYVKSLDKLQTLQFDIIMCAHVLEHITNPQEVIENIRSLLKPKGLLYIELPFDSPFYKSLSSNIQYLLNPHFKLKDIIKQFFKIRKQKKYELHEHINYYTIRAIEELLLRNNFSILKSDVFQIKSDIGNTKAISVIAQLPK